MKIWLNIKKENERNWNWKRERARKTGLKKTCSEFVINCFRIFSRFFSFFQMLQTQIQPFQFNPGFKIIISLSITMFVIHKDFSVILELKLSSFFTLNSIDMVDMVVPTFHVLLTREICVIKSFLNIRFFRFSFQNCNKGINISRTHKGFYTVGTNCRFLKLFFFTTPSYNFILRFFVWNNARMRQAPLKHRFKTVFKFLFLSFLCRHIWEHYYFTNTLCDFFYIFKVNLNFSP